MRLSRRIRASAAAAAAGIAFLGQATVDLASTPSFTVSGQLSKLQASSMAVSGFTYVGTSTFATGPGPTVTALEFTVASLSSVVQLQSILPCHDVGNGLQMASVTEAAAAGASGGFHLFASEVKYTDGTGAHDWTASPLVQPSPGPLESTNPATLTLVDITSYAGQAPTLTATSQTSYAAFCGAGTQFAGPHVARQPAPGSSPSPGSGTAVSPGSGRRPAGAPIPAPAGTATPAPPSSAAPAPLPGRSTGPAPPVNPSPSP